ncbi:terminase [Clostridium botulinum D/C]|uniref:terminase n=1 Tax=Clostridium botulinum TaxID=1491 RepID=UPI001E53F7C2|nr:terminase [Clostridium botulinum]MCD3240818.1 terminase [Clostridium botulinum D/C]
MGLSVKDKETMKWLFADENIYYWIKYCIKIINKETQTVPFILTKQQRYFVEHMLDKNVILKGRQMGFSLVSLALSLREAIISPNSNSLILSYKEKSAQDNFDKLKVMYNNLPKWLKPSKKLDNRAVLQLNNGSKISCQTVGDGDIGRGGTITGILHLTEFAYYGKLAITVLNSAKNSCSSTARIVIETTPKGAGTPYHILYIDAKNHKNDYKHFFFSWLECDELFNKEWDKAVEKYVALYGKKLTLQDNDLDEEELGLIKQGATSRQLMWRRLEISTIGIDKFHEDRPSNDVEAFLTTGSSYFDSKIIDTKYKYLLNSKVVISYATIKKDIENKDLLKLYGKYFKIYQRPESGMKYFAGIDTGDGCGGDFTVMTIFNERGEECAILRSNKIKPFEFADLIYDVGIYYNKALLCIERNHRSGDAILNRLKNILHYQRLFKYKAYDQKRRKVTKWGFDTTEQTKNLILDNLDELFTKDKILINSIETLEEMKTFVSVNGKKNAMNGCHDDTVMATALALWGQKEGKWTRWI